MGPKPSKFHGYIGPIWSNPTPGLDWAAQNSLLDTAQEKANAMRTKSKGVISSTTTWGPPMASIGRLMTKKYYYIYIYVFPNRIENDRNGNKATASVRLHLLLCSWLCGCVSVRCQSHLSQNGFTETLKCSGGVTRQKPPNPPERSARAQ